MESVARALSFLSAVDVRMHRDFCANETTVSEREEREGEGERIERERKKENEKRRGKREMRYNENSERSEQCRTR